MNPTIVDCESGSHRSLFESSPGEYGSRAAIMIYELISKWYSWKKIHAQGHTTHNHWWTQMNTYIVLCYVLKPG